MLNANEISKKYKIPNSNILRAIRNLGLIPVDAKGNIKYYDQFQIGLLIEHLENKGLVKTNLRTIQEIAKVCNTDYEGISRIIHREQIKPIKINPLRFNENQQIIIFTFMYYENRLEYLTFESKMNEAPIYSNREDFIKNGNLTPVG